MSTGTWNDDAGHDGGHDGGHDAGHDGFPESTATIPGARDLPGQPGRRAVHVHLGVEYAVKGGRALHLVVLQPSLDRTTADPAAAAGERFPLVLYVQGSAWREQALGTNLEPLAAIARRGYVVAVVEHRPSCAARFPAQVADAVTALRWLVRNADEFGVDPARIALWGDSSGGHTVVTAAVTAGDPAFTDEPGQPVPAISAVVDFYGPVAFDRMDDEPTTTPHDAPGSPETTLLGVDRLGDAPELLRRADPRTHVSPDRPLPPVLVVHGTKDRLVPFAQSALLVEALRAAGQPVEAVRVRGAGHGGPSLWTPEVLDVVGEFLRSHVG